jgi:hypothetical protein
MCFDNRCNRSRFSKKKWAALLKKDSRGQALILLAVSFFALVAFIGLVTDVGSIYVSYTQLQRAIDSAAVAAANNIKNPQATYTERKNNIREAAREMLSMHDITGVSDLTVYLCSDPLYPPYPSLPANFAAMCPQPGYPPRKLAYVDATQQSPVFFLQIFGVESVPLHATAVGEAAAVDVVVVLDTSESMGVETTGYGDGRDFDPSACNLTNTCEPLKHAKTAAKTLIANLFDGYDQVAIVTFDYDANAVFALSTNLVNAAAAIDNVPLHDDPAAAKIKWTLASPWCGYRSYNPIVPDDRDGNGADDDPGKPCVDEYINQAADCSSPVYTLGANTPDMWDDNTGDACDREDLLDAFDWNGNGIWGEAADDTIAQTKNPIAGKFEDTSLLSTCSGCGLREATDQLSDNGRKDSVWVIVFLSDGIANLSDFPLTNPGIPSSFRYGFCGSDPTNAFWPTYCIDPNSGSSAGRFCTDNDPDECPPDTTPTTTSGPYSVEDYAFDMLDRAALLYSLNENEPAGEDIVVFSIGLGAASAGEALLRYMANVGDDGSRGNDPCETIPALQNCGNYYYAPNASYLSQIFENIAGRIFTKISR